jgi:hypothetical protein
VNSLSEDLAFSSAANCEQSMVGVYDAAQSGFYGGSEVNDRGYIFGAAHIQQGDMRGEDMLLINIFYAFTYQATYTTTTANNVAYWENGFRLNNLANLFIEGVRGASGGAITAAKALEYEAEARLLRAITYHTLLINFARPYLDGSGAEMGLPIIDFGINGTDKLAQVLSTHRSTVAETYDFILADLDFAEANLPALAARTGIQKISRSTKEVAIALKTRVYLHMGDYANVKIEAAKIASQSVAPFSSPDGHVLGATVDAVWNAKGNHIEMMFGMEFMAGTDNLNTNAALARMLGSPSLGARGEYAISPIIWTQSFWHTSDLRRTLLVRNNGVRYFTHKYQDYTNWTDISPIIRYAEVLLNYAEAESRTNGVTALALNLLNAVRDRAKSGAMVSYVLGDFATANAMTQAIINEKRIELLGEGNRWPEIHRLANDATFTYGGIPQKMIAADVANITVYNTPPSTFGIAAIPYADFRYLWPIPNTETTRNPVLAEEQNPGY